jgi:hypothetical protein
VIEEFGSISLTNGSGSGGPIIYGSESVMLFPTIVSVVKEFPLACYIFRIQIGGRFAAVLSEFTTPWTLPTNRRYGTVPHCT